SPRRPMSGVSRHCTASFSPNPAQRPSIDRPTDLWLPDETPSLNVSAVRSNFRYTPEGPVPAPAFMTSISASPSSPTPEGLSPLHVWRAARKHWLLVLFVTAAVTAAAVFYALGHKTIYRSTATLLIDPDPPRPPGKA